MRKAVDWSHLPRDLLDLIANDLFSEVELQRFRSICKTWRSAVGTKKHFRNRSRRRLLSPYIYKPCFLSPVVFYRGINSLCPDKGWLIKTQETRVSSSSKKQLLSPLSRIPIDSPSDETLNLLEFTVSEIHQSYDIQYVCYPTRFISYSFARVVLVEDLVFVINYQKQIWWCNGNETSKPWARIMDEEVEKFSDIQLHKGQIYALDLKGAIWWIKLSEINIIQFTLSTPMKYKEIDHCKDKRFVEYGGDLCVVHRFCKDYKTIGFKVYNMDEELGKWFQVTSLGDKALVMATDTCFTVLAREYYGCLENSIYFNEKDNVKVFKLGDNSITKSAVSSSSQSCCFQMLSPPFI